MKITKTRNKYSSGGLKAAFSSDPFFTVLKIPNLDEKMPQGYVDLIMESEISPICCCWLVGSNHQPQHNVLFKRVSSAKVEIATLPLTTMWS